MSLNEPSPGSAQALWGSNIGDQTSNTDCPKTTSVGFSGFTSPRSMPDQHRCGLELQHFHLSDLPCLQPFSGGRCVAHELSPDDVRISPEPETPPNPAPTRCGSPKADHPPESRDATVRPRSTSLPAMLEAYIRRPLDSEKLSCGLGRRTIRRSRRSHRRRARRAISLFCVGQPTQETRVMQTADGVNEEDMTG